MNWSPSKVTILLPEGDELEAPGFIKGEIALVEHESEWLVLHRRSGLILGRFPRELLARDLADRLIRHVNQGLKRRPESWAEGLWKRLEEIRAEMARENGLPPPPPLRPPPPTLS